MTNVFERLRRERDFLLADGATGTNLFAMGLVSGDAPELWNVDLPERVQRLHRSFVDAGSDLILTNTFGGNRYRLALHGAEARVHELNVAAARLAREVGSSVSREVVVAGSMGPTGELMSPLGSMQPDECVDAFREQATALADGGVDVLWIETMSARDEADAAMAAAAETGLPFVCTLSFDTNGRTMMGVTPQEHARHCTSHEHGPHAFGANCGLGLAEAVTGLTKLVGEAAPDDWVVIKANCGVPEYIDGAIRYRGDEAMMARYACLSLDAGARIIGGCCGTTAGHVAAMRRALDTHVRGAPPDIETIQAELGGVSALVAGAGEVAPAPRERGARRRGRRRRD